MKEFSFEFYLNNFVKKNFQNVAIFHRKSEKHMINGSKMVINWK